MDYKNLLAHFRERSYLVRAYYYTALLETEEYSPLRPLVDWLGYNGYSVVTKPAKEFTDATGRRRVKGSVDIEMAVDVLDLTPHLDHVVIFSGDGDLRRLVEFGAAPRRTGDGDLHHPHPAGDDCRRPAPPGGCLHRPGGPSGAHYPPAGGTAQRPMLSGAPPAPARRHAGRSLPWSAGTAGLIRHRIQHGGSNLESGRPQMVLQLIQLAKVVRLATPIAPQ